MCLRVLSLIILGLTSGFHLAADYVKLKNGDRVSGSIVKADREKMTMNTEFLGEVLIQWDAIEALTADQKLFVTDSDGQVLVGTIATTNGQFEVYTLEAGTVPLAKTVVESLRSEQQQAAHEAEIERLRDPSLLDLWGGYVDTGLSLTQGNSETSTITTSMRTERKTRRDKISLYATSLFARSDVSGVSETTANAIRGGTRYDVDIRDSLFTFGFIDLEFDEFQQLDLRNVLGGGLGWHAKKSERIVFDIFSGGSFNQEFFSNDLTRRSAEIVVGEELTYKISTKTVLSEKAAFYPNLSETGEYRLQFDAALTTDLQNRLAWHLTFSNRFLSNPIPGVKKNDVLLSTGLRFSFGNANP